MRQNAWCGNGIIKLIPMPLHLTLPFLKGQILDYSKIKEFADNNFNFDENGRKYFKQVENTMGRVEIARFKLCLLFPPCFQTYTADM